MTPLYYVQGPISVPL